MLQRGLNTLADLGDSHVIYADCDPCGRSVKLITGRLASMYGAGFTIAQLKHRDIRSVYSVPSRNGQPGPRTRRAAGRAGLRHIRIFRLRSTAATSRPHLAIPIARQSVVFDTSATFTICCV